MAMQGFQVVGYVGARVDSRFRYPINSDKIVKSWARTRKQAEAKKRKMREQYGDVITRIE